MRLIDADALMENYGLKDATKYGNKDAEQQEHSYSTLMLYEIADIIEDAPTVEAKPVEWIPIEWHETTDDDGIDKEKYPLYLDCAMPDDDQEIIICRKNGWVCVDTCVYDDGYSLDSGADWIEDVIAWMPLPKAYNAERGGKNDY